MFTTQKTLGRWNKLFDSEKTELIQEAMRTYASKALDFDTASLKDEIRKVVSQDRRFAAEALNKKPELSCM